MRKVVAAPISWVVARMGYEVVRKRDAAKPRAGFPVDFEPDEIEDYIAVAPYTLTGPVRTVSLMRALRYIARHGIAGDIVECGVWKGGSMMAAARTLVRLGEKRRLWLYDTFEGMSVPTPQDVSVFDVPADRGYRAPYLSIGLEDVRRALLGTGYDEELLTFVPGKVEETIPGRAPDRIALLRLDTDWYESTRHELVHLFPRLTRGGVLIIDDYGHWKGARKATDEYLEQNGIAMLLHRIDFSARFGVKL